MEKITFIIVTWNNENCILDCIDSLYTYCKDFKIIVVDNNSSDNTVKLLQEKKYKNCNIIKLKENVGFAVGNNIGLSKVDTKYICYLNPDTILLEDIIEESINILERNSEIGVVGCKLLNKDMTLQPSTFNFLNHWQVYFEAFKIGKFLPNKISEKYFPNNSKSKKNKIVDWVIGAEMILSTEDANSIKGFSTEYYMYVEDMDLCKKIELKHRKKTFYLSTTKLIHIGGVSESKNANYVKLEKLIENKIKFVKKFYGNKEAKKTIKALYNSYKIRLIILKIFYWMNIEKRRIFIEKMKIGFEISKKEKQKINGGE